MNNLFACNSDYNHLYLKQKIQIISPEFFLFKYFWYGYLPEKLNSK